jgi:hypothetical protein
MGLSLRRDRSMSDFTPIMSPEGDLIPGEIKIEHKNDGSVIITQANLFRLYDDEVTITAGQFAVVFKALQEIQNEIREIESL